MFGRLLPRAGALAPRAAALAMAAGSLALAQETPPFTAQSDLVVLHVTVKDREG